MPKIMDGKKINYRSEILQNYEKTTKFPMKRLDISLNALENRPIKPLIAHPKWYTVQEPCVLYTLCISRYFAHTLQQRIVRNAHYHGSYPVAMSARNRHCIWTVSTCFSILHQTIDVPYTLIFSCVGRLFFPSLCRFRDGILHYLYIWDIQESA